jgi:hypothetical protein
MKFDISFCRKAPFTRKVPRNTSQESSLTCSSHSDLSAANFLDDSEGYRCDDLAPSRRVHFRDECNETRTTRPLLSDEDCTKMWYSIDEMRAFRVDATALAEFVSKASRDSDDPDLWPKLFLRAYRGFCCASRPDDISRAMYAARAPMNDEWIGIERWAIQRINADTKRRRRQMWRTLRRLQDASLSNELISAQMTRKAMRNQSGPSVMYAKYKASLVAQSLYPSKETKASYSTP